MNFAREKALQLVRISFKKTLELIVRVRKKFASFQCVESFAIGGVGIAVRDGETGVARGRVTPQLAVASRARREIAALTWGNASFVARIPDSLQARPAPCWCGWTSPDPIRQIQCRVSYVGARRAASSPKFLDTWQLSRCAVRNPKF